jgi:hypothetical protein
MSPDLNNLFLPCIRYNQTIYVPINPSTLCLDLDPLKIDISEDKFIKLIKEEENE